MRISPVNVYKSTSYKFTGVISPEKKAELQRRADAVNTFVSSAADEGRKINIYDVMASTGYNLNEVRYVFKNYKGINAVWQKVNTSTGERQTPEQIAKKKEEIKVILQKAKDAGKTMSCGELAEKVGMESAAVYKYLSDESLNKLWFWVKTKDRSNFTPEEMQEQSALIKEQLLFAIEKKKAVTIPEITEATGIEGSVIENRINTDETLSSLRAQTLAFEDENYRLEVSTIKKALKEAKETGLKITLVYLSQITSIPFSTLQKRINENNDLNRLFNKVRAKEHNFNSKDEIAAQNKKIESVLNAAVEAGKTMTLGELSSKIPELKKGTLGSRLNKYPELNVLWKKVKKEQPSEAPTAEGKAGQIEKIRQILSKVKDEGKKITLAEIAKETGMTRRVVHTRIQGSETLSALWEATCPVSNAAYTDEEIEVQNVIIERILTRRITDKMKPSYSQMADYLDLSKDIVKQRIEANPCLLALYNRAVQVVEN